MKAAVQFYKTERQQMKKLFFLALISAAANLFCAETKYDNEVDFNKEFTVIGSLEYQGIEGGVWLIKPEDSSERYAIDNEVANKIKNKNKKHKFVLKLDPSIGIPVPGIPVEVISYEEEEEDTSICIIL